MPSPDKAYKNLGFLNSPAARHIRILCEYEEPRQRFLANKVHDTVVFFGSARSKSVEDARDALAHAERELARARSDEERRRLEHQVKKAQRIARMSRYYEETRELARRLTEWDMKRAGPRRYYVCTGGGPGVMEAANRGAAEVEGGRSVGLGISLPFEENVNRFVPEELAFEFHYFFTRKYWFMYLAKAMVLCPGGFGTMDELFESLTLRQTGKVKKPLPTVLYGRDYWDDVMDLQKMVDWGTISEDDLLLFHRSDTVADAFDYLVSELEIIERGERDFTPRKGRGDDK
jgi:uncharacterized protein (TIGR00730 family)